MHVAFVIPALINHKYKLPTNKLVLRGSPPIYYKYRTSLCPSFKSVL